MIALIDKAILFICCFGLYITSVKDPFALVPIIIVVTLSCLCSYLERPFMNRISLLFYSLLCIYNPHFILYLPVICYDVVRTNSQLYFIAPALAVLSQYQELSRQQLLMTAIFTGLCVLARFKTLRMDRLLGDFHSFRDTTKEYELLLKEKNRNLLENQDYEINLATLAERNRISKEIHDNIGHLLSRSLIQIGAMLTLTKEGPVHEALTDLKDSISEGMDSIRNSIHNMHDDSIDLNTQINSLIREFTFCPIHFKYSITSSPDVKLKYSLIAIVKEALSNIMKHSNATEVSIVLMEHPIMYQLIIQDNGKVSPHMAKELTMLQSGIPKNSGMGLQNIMDRVSVWNGVVHFSAESGFQIFITIPKEKN